MKLLTTLSLLLTTSSAAIVQLNGPDESAVQQHVPATGKAYKVRPPTLPSYISAAVVEGQVKCRAYHDVAGTKQVGHVFDEKSSTGVSGAVRSLRVRESFTYSRDIWLTRCSASLNEIRPWSTWVDEAGEGMRRMIEGFRASSASRRMT